MHWIIFGIIISYLIGSVPTAYIFGRLLKGADIRKFGSGNVGATNALRLLGKGPGIAVLAIDILKGFAAVFFLGNSLVFKVPGIPPEVLFIIAGVSCIVGHNWTVFLGFKGGKGVAATLGVLLGLAAKVAGLKIVLALLLATWLIVFLISRIISLASVLSAVTLPIYMILSGQSRVLVISGIILSVFVIMRHKANLKRLLEGKEPRIK